MSPRPRVAKAGDVPKLRKAARAARSAADKAARDARSARDRARDLAVEAVKAEAELDRAEFIERHEREGYTIREPEPGVFKLDELPDGPTHSDGTG